MATPAEAFERLLEVLDKMEIPYHVGGPVASSAHGVPRTTMDVDLVVDLRPDQIDEFVTQTGKDFYVDAQAMKESFALNGSCNLIHFASTYKFDLFPLRKDEYSGTEFARRAFTIVEALGPEPVECAVASAEDTILRKLEWYRKGGETSERQWNDLRSVVRVSGARLDLEYLRKWDPYLAVADLLDELLGELRPS